MYNKNMTYNMFILYTQNFLYIMYILYCIKFSLKKRYFMYHSVIVHINQSNKTHDVHDVRDVL